MLNPISWPPSLSWSSLLNVLIYECVVIIIELLCLTFTFRWRLREPLYGRAALAVLTANIASFFLVSFSLIFGDVLVKFLISLLLTFFIEYIIITGIFFGLKMLPKDAETSMIFILLPVVFLSNLFTLLLGIIPLSLGIYY